MNIEDIQQLLDSSLDSYQQEIWNTCPERGDAQVSNHASLQ